MHTVETPIDPLEFCPECPRSGDCQGVAGLAIDSYMKASFFSMQEIPGDPDVFVTRQYVDAAGGMSDTFLESDDTLIRECLGPEVVQKRLFRQDITDCGAFVATQQKLDALRAARTVQDAARRESAVYMTPDEIAALRALPDDQLRLLSALSTAEMNELVLFGREHPEQVGELRALNK